MLGCCALPAGGFDGGLDGVLDGAGCFDPHPSASDTMTLDMDIQE